MTHVTEDELVLHYYGEMRDEARTAEHLATCATCQQNYARLQRVMALVDSAPLPDAPDGFERLAWARLQAALPVRERGWIGWLAVSRARALWASAAILVVLAAFVAGRLWPRTTTPADVANARTDSVRERILLVDLGEHLDRSQMVLVELVSGDAAGDVDISMEQARAQQLLASNRLYRQTAERTGDAAMSAVLDDLERVLIDIAASPKVVSQADLEMVRRRIASQELLFKVRVVSSQVRERQKAASQERTDQRAIDTTKG